MTLLKRLLFLLIFYPSVLQAQDSILISREALLKNAADKNLQVRIAEQAYLAAEAGYSQTRAMYLPNLNLSYTAMSTSSPLMAFGSKLNQERVGMADFNPALLNDPGSIQNFGTKLEVQQPILNYDAVYQRKAARAKADALKFKMERSAEYVIFELERSYMQLQMAYKAQYMLKEAKQTALANLKLVTDYYNNGMLQKSELLNVQVRVTEIDNQLQYAGTNIRNASDYINFLLNSSDSNQVLKPSDSLVPEKTATALTSLNPARKDLAAYNKSLEAYTNMVTAAKKKLLPRLNAFGSYEFNDKKITAFRGEGYMVGLQASWNIFDGFKTRGSIAQAKAEYRLAEEEFSQYKAQSRLELNKTTRQLHDAENKMWLTKLAWEQTQEAYRIRRNRFTQGLEKTADLLNAETLVLQKELEYRQAIFEYNSTAAYLRFLNK
ncbi:MAG: TolC family protein [Ferruginibacter sp.]